jgi:hypothetical protein
MEEGIDPLWGLFEFRHMLSGRSLEFGLGAHRHFGANGVLEVGIQAFLGVQLRAVARAATAIPRSAP